MLKKLGLVDLISALQSKIEQHTGVRCYDSVPKNAPSPFYFAEVVGKRTDDTKTMFCEVFEVWVHAISEPEDNGSSIGIYRLIESLEESMTEDIVLQEGYNLIRQANTGVQTIKTEETKEKHAVIAYDFKVSYGFKVK